MPVIRNRKKQYVEHYEEYVGEEAKPYVAYLTEEPMRYEKGNAQQKTNEPTAPLEPVAPAKRSLPFWKRIAALFS
ncbi:MAG TPA: hypothetical protein PKD70_01825 [Saprospiraceae bacterium]|nr:hypothetical protein [Saprospiraceae bacterium]HMP12588.1 hypothetical protein [Saprospiraceae bacterium]